MDYISWNTFALGVFTMAPQALPHEMAMLRPTILTHIGAAQILLLRNLEIMSSVAHISEQRKCQHYECWILFSLIFSVQKKKWGGEGGGRRPKGRYGRALIYREGKISMLP